ncbi:MAG: RNA methyltransferase [Polyangiaceae bacterium]
MSDASEDILAGYRNVRDQDHVRRGTFICEGENVLRVLLGPRSRYRPSSVLLSESRAAALRPYLDALPWKPIVHVREQAVLDGIVGFPLHRGVLAEVPRPADTSAPALLESLGEGPLRILVLSSIVNHDNVGLLFRSAAAFGIDAILLDEVTCDPLYRKAIRVSVGGALVLPFARAPMNDILASLEARCVTAYGFSPAGERALGDVAPQARSAIILGTEGRGLDADVLERVERVRIPIGDTMDSLNVGVAGSIACYAFSRRPSVT